MLPRFSTLQFKAQCPHCNNKAATDMVSIGSESEYWADLYAICEVCQGRSLWNLSSLNREPTLIWPRGIDYEGVLPESVASLVSEANQVRPFSPSSYVVLMGRAIEALCDSYGVKQGKKNLSNMIADLGKQLDLPTPFLDMASGIRKFRNFGAHHTEVILDSRHVHVIASLFDALMDYLYLSPARIEAFNELADEVNNTVKSLGQWIVFKNGIDTRHGEVDYFISKARIKESDWVAHMMSKEWVNMTDFCNALYFAREYYHLGHHNRTELHVYQHPYWIPGREDRNEVMLDPLDFEALEDVLNNRRSPNLMGKTDSAEISTTEE